MKQFLKSHLKVVVFAIVFSVFAVSGAILGCLSTLVPKTSSITSTDTTSFVKIGEIFNSTDKVFYGDTLSQFYHCITGTSGATVDTVKSKINSATNKVIPASTIRGYTASGTGYSKSNTQSVVVRLGGLDWIVTYLSLNTDGDVIATLWLDDNVQDKWLADTTTYSQTAGEYYGFIDGGLYSDFSVSNDSTGNYGTELYPHNLYSTSYVRAATLNNGSGYAIEDNSATLTTATQNATNPFAMYTMEQFGLTKFLEKPKNISWQVNAQTPSLSLGNYQGTQLNNDALSVGGNYTDGTNVHNYCNEVITPEKYAEWGNDYIWLPSISETGYSDTYSGIWNLNSTERASATGVNEEIYGGIGTIGLVGHTDCFTRSAANYPVTSGVYAPSFYNFIVSATGSSYSSYSREANAIRPALHLNLSDVYTGFNIQTNINIFSAGTITGGGVYSPNDDVTLTATPNIGYIFQYWENSAGTIVSYSSTYTFTAIATDTYTAVFKEISVSFTTPNSGAEILEQLTNTNEIIIANNFVFVSGKYISSI
ncbi:MAG: hypothetical protein J6C13_01455, partial [Clostridia bacterium]|nr:hypothetical protein [Clostridia bacterium]